jgi:hypothetical protein
VRGLAWSPDGREVWFTAGGPARNGESSSGTLKELHAVSLEGRERLLLRMAGDVTLQDVSRDGRVLISYGGRSRWEARGKLSGDGKEHDLTYLGGTYMVGISADGKTVLFADDPNAPQGGVFIRRATDVGPIRLGEGIAIALSPDGRRAYAGDHVFQSGARHTVLSAGPEPPRELSRGTLDRIGWGQWMADGQRVIFAGWEKDRPVRSYVVEPPDGQPKPISPEGTECKGAMGQRWLPCFHIQDEHGEAIRVWELRSLDGQTRPAPWIGAEDYPVAWSPDGAHAFVAIAHIPPFRVFRVEVGTGRREPWLDSSPPDLAGVGSFPAEVTLTPDGRYYAYSYPRTLSDLFLVEGLR